MRILAGKHELEEKRDLTERKKEGSNMDKPAVDKPIILVSGGICLSFVLWATLMPEHASSVLTAINAFICSEFGWLYLLSVTLFLAFLIWLMFSKYGKLKLGKDTDKPQYSTWSWFAMLFAAGMGIGIVFWSVAEPMSHDLNPLTADPRTPEAAADAMRITFVHWGLHPWACFGIVGVAIAYFQFRKEKPGIVSSCLEPLIGQKRVDGFWGRTVSVLVIFSTVFGVAVSLGMGAMQINSGLAYIVDVPFGTTAMIVVIAVTAFVFVMSAVSGIDRGIKRLSNLNMVLLAILLLSVFFFGPSASLLDTFVTGIGDYLGQIIPQSLWADPYGANPGWLDSWTVFYWAWWISWGPFVGMWLARISKGRTVREFVLGAVFVPAILSFLAIAILGGSALIGDLGGNTTVADAVQQDTSFALFALLYDMPFGQILSGIATLLIFIFFITSADSATFVCAMQTSGGGLNPPRSLMAFIGIVEALVAIALLMTGGLSSLQMAAIISAFPFMIVCIFVAVSFTKAIRGDASVNSGGSSEAVDCLEPADFEEPAEAKE